MNFNSAVSMDGATRLKHPHTTLYLQQIPQNTIKPALCAPHTHTHAQTQQTLLVEHVFIFFS